ncbi:MAG: F0F1 ATP synthase subunit epsilon [Pseudomonadota bacterium]
MSGFTLQLYDGRGSERIEGVSSFVGEDASGSFALLPGHAPLMTTLVFGLARFRREAQTPWQYLAMPGAVLYFLDNTLNLACRHYLMDEDYGRITQRLNDELLAEEEQIRALRESINEMEREMFKQMWELGQQGIRLQ